MHLLCLTFKRFWLRSTRALKVFVCVEAEQWLFFTLSEVRNGLHGDFSI